LEYSIETEPLGTGGALLKAADSLESDAALILNGDSYTDADLSAFARDYHDSEADLSMLVVPADGRVDSGSVSVDAGGRVLGFREKQGVAGTQFLNAGIYMAAKNMLHGASSGVQISLEKELFPGWLAEGRYLRAFVHAGACIDIGTPERYRRAQASLAHVEDGEVTLNPRGDHA
jgi:mannose-1-phosphate guanylyltransferase